MSHHRSNIHNHIFYESQTEIKMVGVGPYEKPSVKKLNYEKSSLMSPMRRHQLCESTTRHKMWHKSRGTKKRRTSDCLRPIEVYRRKHRMFHQSGDTCGVKTIQSWSTSNSVFLNMYIVKRDYDSQTYAHIKWSVHFTSGPISSDSNLVNNQILPYFFQKIT